MDGITSEKLSLQELTRREVEAYAGTMHQARLIPFADEVRQVYGISVIPDDREQRPAWVMLLARVVGETIIIEEDTAMDKPLHQALMVNAEIPREQIILAYKGETLPDS